MAEPGEPWQLILPLCATVLKGKNEGSNITCFLGGVQHQLPTYTCYNRVNLEDIMLSEINHKDCIRKCDTFHDSTYMWYLVRLIETESRMVVPRGLGGGEVGN